MAAEEAHHGGLAALAVWLRLAAMRKLTWNRESDPFWSICCSCISDLAQAHASCVVLCCCSEVIALVILLALPRCQELLVHRAQPVLSQARLPESMP